MDPEGLSLRVEREDRGAVVWVSGEIDIATAPKLDECLRKQGWPLTVEFSGVTFMDSSGVSVLATAAKRAARQGGELVLRGVRARERKVLEITRMDTVLKIEDA